MAGGAFRILENRWAHADMRAIKCCYVHINVEEMEHVCVQPEYLWCNARTLAQSRLSALLRWTLTNTNTNTLTRNLGIAAVSSGVQCPNAKLNSNPCLCFGGAARQAGIFETVRKYNDVKNEGTLTLDAGGYTFGKGLFFPWDRGTTSVSYHPQKSAACTTPANR